MLWKMFLKFQNYKLAFGKSKGLKIKNQRKKKNSLKIKKTRLVNFIQAKTQINIKKINQKICSLGSQKKWEEIKLVK